MSNEQDMKMNPKKCVKFLEENDKHVDNKYTAKSSVSYFRKKKYYNPDNRGTKYILTDIKDEREIEKLIDSETKRPKLLPIPDMTHILAYNLNTHPLWTFRVDKLKRHHVDVYL